MRMSSVTTLRIVIGGREYDKPYDEACPACASSHVLQIDNFLAYGWGFGRIRRYLGAMGENGIASDDLRGHISHLAAPHHQARMDYEADMSAAGIDTEKWSAPDLTSLLRITLQRAYERVTDGEQEVSVRDAVALLKIKREIERDQALAGQQATADQWQQATIQILWIARKHLGKSWAAFADEIRNDQAIRAATGGMMAEPAERKEIAGASSAGG